MREPFRLNRKCRNVDQLQLRFHAIVNTYFLSHRAKIRFDPKEDEFDHGAGKSVRELIV